MAYCLWILLCIQLVWLITHYYNLSRLKTPVPQTDKVEYCTQGICSGASRADELLCIILLHFRDSPTKRNFVRHQHIYQPVTNCPSATVRFCCYVFVHVCIWVQPPEPSVTATYMLAQPCLDSSTNNFLKVANQTLEDFLTKQWPGCKLAFLD